MTEIQNTKQYDLEERTFQFSKLFIWVLEIGIYL
jgi:hypothetical protein